MLLEPQDSKDGFCLTVPGGTQGLQKAEDDSWGETWLWFTDRN